ncbi:MAG: carbohydrate kinase family protein [Eubacteriales bacterium]|nr:carbohydrate kinase family protein [Eubacteriales bacterium]
MNNYVVVIGGANVDISASSFNAIKMEDSNPGKIEMRPGGVGRNIAENLCRLGVDTYLISALSDDVYSKLIKDDSATFGLHLEKSAFVKNSNCGLYLCINDPSGDMLVAVNSMEICNAITPEIIEQHLDFINKASLVVLDTNIPEQTLHYICDTVTAPLACDLVSVAKCSKMKSKLGSLSILKANRFEAEAISGMKIEKQSQLEEACKKLCASGIKNVIVTLGAQGAYYYNQIENGHIAPVPCTVMNTTGCGDAFMGAACACFINNPSLCEMAKYGIVAASLTASHNGPVMPYLSIEMIERQKKNLR